MKPTLTVLIEGYAYPADNGTYLASPTTTLLQFHNNNYIVDPGCNGPLLLERLTGKNLLPSDIAALFITHYHLDHILNIRLFPKTPLYDGSMRWEQDQEIPYADYWLFPEFRIIPTPGHAGEQYSLLVDTENYGLVCIAQDIFWWEDGKQKSGTVAELLETEDPFLADKQSLQESRQKVLESGAKWIIPGHGKMFKNPAYVA